MKSNPYTYHISWTNLNIHYYGVRISKKRKEDDLWVNYFTSSKYVHQFRKEFGDPDLIEIRKVFSSEILAKNWETKVLSRLKVRTNPKWLNRYDTTYHGSTKPKTDNHKEKIAQSLKGKTKSDEHRKNLSNSITGSFTWITDGYNNRQIKIWLLETFLSQNGNWYRGYTTSEETKEKQSNTRKRLFDEGVCSAPNNKGRIKSAETCQKISSANKGKKRSNETKQRISRGVSGIHNGMFGKRHSDEIKKALSEKSKKMKWYNNGKQNLYIKDGDDIPEHFVRGRLTGWNTHPG